MLEALSQAVGRRHKTEAEAWTTDRELLATITELLHQLIIITLAANGSKDAKHMKPIHVPRPYEKDDEKGSGSPMTIRDFARASTT